MLEVSDDKVTFSRKTWEDLKEIDYYKEVIEAIEDREELIKAKEETEYFVDYEEYRNNRLKKMNV